MHKKKIWRSSEISDDNIISQQSVTRNGTVYYNNANESEYGLCDALTNLYIDQRDREEGDERLPETFDISGSKIERLVRALGGEMPTSSIERLYNSTGKRIPLHIRRFCESWGDEQCFTFKYKQDIKVVLLFGMECEMTVNSSSVEFFEKYPNSIVIAYDTDGTLVIADLNDEKEDFTICIIDSYDEIVGDAIPISNLLELLIISKI
jgi:hypothetical protein